MQTTATAKVDSDNEAQPAKRVRFIFLICFLEADQHRAALKQHYDKLSQSKCAPCAAVLDSVWAGYCALQTEAISCALHLRDRGHLLFAHPGTTVLQGCAV